MITPQLLATAPAIRMVTYNGMSNRAFIRKLHSSMTRQSSSKDEGDRPKLAVELTELSLSVNPRTAPALHRRAVRDGETSLHAGPMKAGSFRSDRCTQGLSLRLAIEGRRDVDTDRAAATSGC